jgi:competence protein ComEA
MPLPGRRLVLAACAVLLLAAVLAGRVLRDPATAGPAAAVATAAADGAELAPAPPDAPVEVAVHVAGAVRRPGVYFLPPGSRARDAIRRAGGATRRADLAGVNLAALVADGEQLVVPVRAPAGAPAGAPANGGGERPPGIVHLNGADADALDTLPGVGPALAERIVAFGRENGGFRSVDDLLEVPGIGPGRLEAIRPLVAP